MTYNANSFNELASELLTRFKGNRRFIAAFMPKPEPKELRTPLTPEQFAARHLSQERCLGFYLIDPADDTVSVSCLDFDDHDGSNPDILYTARMVASYLQDSGCHPLLERSQSGRGYHVWVLHEGKLPAEEVRRFWKVIQQDTQTTSEIYPRQDGVQHLEERLGNFIRYPLWNDSRFESVRGEILDPITALRTWQATPNHLVSKVAQSYTQHKITQRAGAYQTEGIPDSVISLLEDDPTSILARRWAGDASGMDDDSQSSLACSIATELVRGYIPTPEIEAALRWWCDKQQYDKDDRWIQLTGMSGYKFARNPSREQKKAGTFRTLLHAQIDSLAQGDIAIIPSGIEAIDNSIQGIGLSEFGLLTARTNHGKTAVALQWLDSAASRGFPGLFISLEMTIRATMKRMLSRLRYDPKTLHERPVGEVHAEIERRMLEQAPIHFEDCEPDLSTVLKTCERYIVEHGVKLIVIDHQGIMSSDDFGEAKQQEMISRRLRREVAQKFDVSVLSLIQMNRQIERDGNRDPVLADVRFGGENEADMVLAARWMFREEPQPENYNCYLFHVLKMRDRGFTEARLPCLFFPESQSFGVVDDL